MDPAPIAGDPAVARAALVEDELPALHQVHRSFLGMHPLAVLGAAASLALVLAVILLAAGSVVGGVILLLFAIAAGALFVGGVRRDRDAPIARATVRAVDRVRAFVGVITVAVGAWLRAGVDLIRIRGREQRLRRELKATLAPLGEAVHQRDQQRADALESRASELEERLSDAEREASMAVAAARHKIGRERATIEPTEVLGAPQAPDESTAPGSS